MTIYDIDSAIAALIDPETGELGDYEAFQRLQLAREAKIENLALLYKEVRATAEAIKAETEKLIQRRSAEVVVEQMYFGDSKRDGEGGTRAGSYQPPVTEADDELSELGDDDGPLPF